jgi:hypothetical protein
MTSHEVVTKVVSDAFVGGVSSMIVAIGVVAATLILFAFYIYFALAWYSIAKKLKYRYPWLAWIPFANAAMVLQLGGFHWAWIFLALIPLIGWIALAVITIIATWRIFERRKYPGWFSLAPVLPYIGPILYLITIGFVAWKDQPKRSK